MTDKIFAVIRTRGPAWNDSQPLEGQDDWRAHADFMNGLVADGFVLLGGPLEGTPDVLLIVRAADQAAGRRAPGRGLLGGQGSAAHPAGQSVVPQTAIAQRPLTLRGRTTTLAVPPAGNEGGGRRHCHAKPRTRPHRRPVRPAAAVRIPAARSRGRGADQGFRRPPACIALPAGADRAGAGAGAEGRPGAHRRTRGQGGCGARRSRLPGQRAQDRPVGIANRRRPRRSAAGRAVDTFAAAGRSGAAAVGRRQLPAHARWRPPPASPAARCCSRASAV